MTPHLHEREMYPESLRKAEERNALLPISLHMRFADHNIVGSPIVEKCFDEYGRELRYYKDGSMMIADMDQEEYHFFSQQGLQHQEDLLRHAQEIFDRNQMPTDWEKIGVGKNDYPAEVYQFNMDGNKIAARILSGHALREQETRVNNIPDNNNYILERSLVVVQPVLEALRQARIQTPQVHSLSLRTHPDFDTIQCIQFNEYLAGPTLSQLQIALDSDLNKKVNQQFFEEDEDADDLTIANDFITDLIHFGFDLQNIREVISYRANALRIVARAIDQHIEDIGPHGKDNVIVSFDPENQNISMGIVDLSIHYLPGERNVPNWTNLIDELRVTGWK